MENVEKFCFSTEKPDFTNKRTKNQVDKFLHKDSHNPNCFVLRYRKSKGTAWNFLPKKLVKCSSTTNCGRLYRSQTKNLCEKPPKFSGYHFAC